METTGTRVNRRAALLVLAGFALGQTARQASAATTRQPDVEFATDWRRKCIWRNGKKVCYVIR